MRPRTLFLASSVLTAALVAACSQPQQGEKPSPTPPAPPSDAQADVAVAPTPAATDAGADQGPVDAGPTGPMIGALFMQTPVMNEMDWPTKADEDPVKRRKRRGDKDPPKRIGHLRQGGMAAVIPEPHKTANCQEGWYELVAGGFVCGKYATLDLSHPRIKTGPHAPFTDRGLPYDYATNTGHGTPLYRTIPSHEDRVRFEPWLTGVARKPAKGKEENPYDTSAPSPTATASPTDPMGLGVEELDAGTPWYLRDWDGGKPQVTLDDLRGEGPIVRRMVRGFYVALDRMVDDGGRAKWWKTTAGYLAPFDRMYVAKPMTDFHGVWLNTETPPAYPGPVAQDGGATPPYWVDKPPTHLPMGFVSNQKSKKYSLSADKKKATASSDTISRYTPIQLTGNREVVAGVAYLELEGGAFMRAIDLAVMEPGPAPTDLATGEKWIDVNLASQTLVMFEGDKAVYATMVSTGKTDKVNKEKDHSTPTGTFRIREKHIAATMDGDVASDGPYSIEDVPWIMYFSGSYALHGAFWHNNFGHKQSHGCVNLAPNDARAIFGWTEPRLPDGWHGVWGTEEHPGTRVVVHDGPVPATTR